MFILTKRLQLLRTCSFVQKLLSQTQLGVFVLRLCTEESKQTLRLHSAIYNTNQSRKRLILPDDDDYKI